MANYAQQVRLLLVLLLGSLVASGLAAEEHPEESSEVLHRNKRTLTTICVEIKPSGPQEEPYFMCKGTDITRGGSQPQAYAAADQQTTQGYAQPDLQPTALNGQTPFPSFPSFGAGFFPIVSNYEEGMAKATSATSYTNQAPPSESLGHKYGAAAAAFAPAPAAQPYGMPAVSYPGAGGPAAAAHGTAAIASAASTAAAYADAAAQKPPAIGQGAAASKSQSPSSQAGNGQAYDSVVATSPYRTGPIEDVLDVPDVGFRQEELNMPYRRPVGHAEPTVGAAPQMVWLPLVQVQPPAASAAIRPPPYYDDPIMRTFYASLEPQVAQAAPMHQAALLESDVGQVVPTATGTAPAYTLGYGQTAPPTQPPAAQPAYPANHKASPDLAYSQSPAIDGNACNSCTRACATALDSSVSYQISGNCPSFQPVIIAMPCYGQQQPTHYLAVPGSAGGSSPALTRDNAVGNHFGGPFGLGSPFQQVGQHFGMPAPQVGSYGPAFGMGPHVGAPFGMAPILNPFGPFGSLNPFNPFNRILGNAAPPTQPPRQRLFGVPDESSTPTTTTLPASSPAMASIPNFSSSTPMPASKSTPGEFESAITRDPAGGKKTDPDDDNDHDNDGDDDDDDVEENDAKSDEKSVPSKASTFVNPDDDSLEGKDLSADQLIAKGEEKLKPETKRKRQNSRSGSGSQKRKYLQRL